jgi:hypothetical protein
LPAATWKAERKRKEKMRKKEGRQKDRKIET